MDNGRPSRADRVRPTPAKVLGHPLRVRILEVLNQRDMSPAEFCGEGFAPDGMEVSQVAHHFRELAEYGSLAVVERGPRRGSDEHVYRGLGRAYFSDDQWEELGEEQRIRISRTVIQGLVGQVEGALSEATFDARVSRHLTWIAMRLDEQGWSEMTTALTAAFGEVEQIRTDAEARLDHDGEEGIHATCGILGFPSPPGPRRIPPPTI